MPMSAFGDLSKYKRTVPKKDKPNIIQVEAAPVTSYTCCLTIEDFDKYMTPVFEDGIECAFDIETAPLDLFRDIDRAALDPHKSEITGISFSHTPGTAIYVPLTHRTGRNFELTIDPFLFLLDVAFFRSRCLKIAHNIAFESGFFYKHGIVIQAPAYDTIAASQLTLKTPQAFRELKDSGLKTLTSEILKVKQTKFLEVTGGKHFDELDPEDPATIEYACADSDYALQLRRYFKSWFEANIPRHEWYCMMVDTPACIYTGLMKYNGIAVDQDLMQVKKLEAEAKMADLRKEILAVVGPGIDIGKNASTKAMETWMYDMHGFPVLRRTETGGRAMDDETFQLLIDWCNEYDRQDDIKLIRLLQEYRKWGKMLSTYIDGYTQHINSVTGRIHADLMPTVTDTSRFAARNPNLQNMPRKDNDPTGVRKFFVAEGDNMFIDFDFSQIELRVGAVYCRDEKMLETYRSGGDIHAQTTSVIYGISVQQAKDKNAENYKERRTIAKNCNFGVFFGLFGKGLQRTLKFKAGVEKYLEECEQIINNLKTGYPGIPKWQEYTKKRASERGYTETAFGFRRILVGIHSSDWGVRSFWERASMNTPIQGTAAGILKLALGRLLKELADNPWLKPLLQIHDELLFECPPDKQAAASEIIRRCMEEKPFEAFDVPIKAEGAWGKCFGEMEELED